MNSKLLIDLDVHFVTYSFSKTYLNNLMYQRVSNNNSCTNKRINNPKDTISAEEKEIELQQT